MGSTDPLERSATRVELLEGLRERLERAEALAAEVRRALGRADAEAIEAATARLETLGLEFKLLDAEYRRIPTPADGPSDREHERARAAFEVAATRLARSAATSSGLLERLVAMSRGLSATLQAALGETYRPTGRTREATLAGLRLRKQA